jgi:hypothetical protein
MLDPPQYSPDLFVNRALIKEHGQVRLMTRDEEYDLPDFPLISEWPTRRMICLFPFSFPQLLKRSPPASKQPAKAG